MSWRFPLLVAASLGVHGLTFVLSPAGAASVREPAPARAEWVRLPPLAPEVPREPAPEPPPPITTAATPAVAPRPTTPRPRPAQAPSEPVAEAAPTPSRPAALDLTGVTLTAGSGGAGWAPLGNGEASAGPARLGRGGSGPAAPEAPAVDPAPVGPRTVPIADLGRPPRPPELGDALRSAYPPDERDAGRRGEALVRVRLAPTGRVAMVDVLRSSSPAFGAACRDVLRRSQWEPPLDRDGSAVATVVQYRCQFEIR